MQTQKGDCRWCKINMKNTSLRDAFCKGSTKPLFLEDNNVQITVSKWKMQFSSLGSRCFAYALFLSKYRFHYM